MKRKAPEQPPASIGRHETQCRICQHPGRESIEAEFIAWKSVDAIAKTHKVSRDGIYRHAHTFGLLDKRQRNVRAALERIIEQAGEVQVNAAAVVAAVAAYSKINAMGQWIDRRETVNLNELFMRMSEGELGNYAATGQLPDWFSSLVGATPTDSQQAENAG
jgi:hypothetical protein